MGDGMGVHSEGVASAKGKRLKATENKTKKKGVQHDGERWGGDCEYRK